MQKEISDMKQIKTGSCSHLLERHLKFFLNQEKKRTKIYQTLSLLEVKGLVNSRYTEDLEILAGTACESNQYPGRRTGATSRRLVSISL